MESEIAALWIIGLLNIGAAVIWCLNSREKMKLKRIRPYKVGQKCAALIFDERKRKYIFRVGKIIARTRDLRKMPDSQWQYAFSFGKKVVMVEHWEILKEFMEA